MGFWSGFEGLTGHQPGAFKGFSFKDILDEDMWKRIDRKFPSPRYAEEGLPTPKTAWYKGMGRPEMMGPRVGGAGVPVNLAATGPTYQDRFDATTLANQQRRNALWGSGPSTVSAARPWANLQPDNLTTPSWAGAGASADRDVGMGANRFLQLGDPRNIRAGPDLPPASRSRPLPPAGRDRPVPMADKTTVVEKFEDPLKSNKVTTTIKEKLDQAGLSLNRTANERVVPATPPGTTDIFSHGQWMPVDQAANWQPDAGAKAKPFWGLQDWYRDLARRRYEESMRARRGY